MKSNYELSVKEAIKLKELLDAVGLIELWGGKVGTDEEAGFAAAVISNSFIDINVSALDYKHPFKVEYGLNEDFALKIADVLIKYASKIKELGFAFVHLFKSVSEFCPIIKEDIDSITKEAESETKSK